MSILYLLFLYSYKTINKGFFSREKRKIQQQNFFIICTWNSLLQALQQSSRMTWVSLPISSIPYQSLSSFLTLKGGKFYNKNKSFLALDKSSNENSKSLPNVIYNFPHGKKNSLKMVKFFLLENQNFFKVSILVVIYHL